MRFRIPIALAAAAMMVGAVSGLPSRASNDPLFSKQYAPQQAGAPEAWTKSRGAGVTIAVLDSGVDLDHPDLASKIDVFPGSDMQDNDDHPDDDTPSPKQGGGTVEGHGTGVASVAAAIVDNGIGMAGIAPDSRIMPIRLVGPEGGTNTAVRVPRAIRFAVDHGAKVINLSLATFKGVDLVGVIETPCFEAFQRGALCVVASGNLGNDRPSGYARSLHALLVTANDRDGKPTDFGQPADTQWGISAPGIHLIAATPKGSGYVSGGRGTSLAAPHVSGAAALLFAVGKSAQEVVDTLLQTARPTDNPTISGAGILDLAAAFSVARAAPEFGGGGGDAPEPVFIEDGPDQQAGLLGAPIEAAADADVDPNGQAAGFSTPGGIVFMPDPDLPVAFGPATSGARMPWPLAATAASMVLGIGAITVQMWRRRSVIR